MRNKPPVNDNITSKIIPGLLNDYRIVSLPYWAWYWLEDFMVQNRMSYQGIYETYGQNHDLGKTLHRVAELHHEQSMRNIYNLANDNEPSKEHFIPKIYHNKKSKPLNLPRIYKLFGFMSCATTLEAVWERRHYKDTNKIK